MVVWTCIALGLALLLGFAAFYDRRRRGHDAPGLRRKHPHEDRQSSDAALQAQVHDMKNGFGPQ